MQVEIDTKGEKAIRRIGEEAGNGSTEKGPAGEPGRRAQEHRKNRDVAVKKGSGGGAGSGDDRKRARETEAAGKGKAARQGQQDRDARIHPSCKKKRTRVGSAVGTNSKQRRNVESRGASACERPEREIAPEGNKYQPPLTPPGRCRRLRSGPAARRTARPRPAKYSSSASGRSHS